MSNDELREHLIKALEEMKKKALDMKIQGVGVAAILNKDESVDWIGEMQVVEMPFNFKEGWNLIAIAWSKCGEAMATGADSGDPEHEKILGECGFVGGAYEEYEGYKMAFAFSGALSEEDLEVAKYGIAFMKNRLKPEIKKEINMLSELVLKNRSYRRYYENERVDEEVLRKLIDMARNTPSAANLQSIRYKLITDTAMCEKLFPYLGWAGYLKDWDGPEEGERPAAYIVMATDEKANATIDEGIAGQTILLGAVEAGLGGCFLGNIRKEQIAKLISLPEGMKIDYVIALGKPKEAVVLENIRDNDVKYYRDADGVHHVPKRTLDEVLL